MICFATVAQLVACHGLGGGLGPIQGICSCIWLCCVTHHVLGRAGVWFLAAFWTAGLVVCTHVSDPHPKCFGATASHTRLSVSILGVEKGWFGCWETVGSRVIGVFVIWGCVGVSRCLLITHISLPSSPLPPSSPSDQAYEPANQPIRLRVRRPAGWAAMEVGVGIRSFHGTK